jgi:hypothetical protein
MLRRHVVPSRHLRHNRARLIGLPDYLAFDLIAPPAPTANTRANINAAAVLRSLNYIVNHICEPIQSRSATSSGSDRTAQDGDRAPLTISAAIREVEFSYPTQAELAEVGPDTIGQLTAHMVEAGHLAEADVGDLKKEVQAIVDDAAQFALQSPQPTMEAAWAHMNCNRHHEILI